MLFNPLQSSRVLEDFATTNSNKRRKGSSSSTAEPTSVLEKRRSLSPPNSSSTLSSSLGSGGGGGSAASSDSAAGAPEIRPVPPSRPPPPQCSEQQHLEDWEAMLSDSGAGMVVPPISNGNNSQDQSYLRWLMDDSSGSGFGLVDPSFGFADPTGGAPSLPSLPPQSLPNPLFLSDASPIEEKPLLFNPFQAYPSQNSALFLPMPQFPAHIETHQTHFPDSGNINRSICSDNNNSLFLRRNQPQNLAFSNPAAAAAQMKTKMGSDDQALVDSLFKAAEFVEAGNYVGARGILARLNQQLPSHPVIGKPLFRSAFYFKEALLLLTNNTPPNPTLSTPLDVLLKLGTYKAFSEILPILQFTNFTSIQAILEVISGSNHIHVIDFDVGVGGHWSSFMQELAHRRGGAIPSLRITAFASHSSHHPLELHLTRENLSHFAADLNIPFEFNVLSLDSFDPAAVLAMSGVEEAIAVNFPIGSVLNCQSVPAIVRLIRQLNPKIVVSVEHWIDRSDLQFSHRFLHLFQSCSVLLDSVDASGANHEVANKIERYLVQPRIENAVLGCPRPVEKLNPWRDSFASAGFLPIQFSNFTETQAECLLKRVQVRGFQVEKRQASLYLCWQRGELVSVSAWKC